MLKSVFRKSLLIIITISILTNIYDCELQPGTNLYYIVLFIDLKKKYFIFFYFYFRNINNIIIIIID
jgi:hypothetical protein